MSNRPRIFDALVYSPMKYILCVDEKAFKKLMKTRTIVKSAIPVFIPGEGGAVTYIFNHNITPEPFILVNIPLDIDISDEYIRRVLIHESVHVWQSIREFLTTKIDSSDDTLWEVEAYAIDTIANNLMETFFELREKRAKKLKEKTL